MQIEIDLSDHLCFALTRIEAIHGRAEGHVTMFFNLGDLWSPLKLLVHELSAVFSVKFKGRAQKKNISFIKYEFMLSTSVD